MPHPTFKITDWPITIIGLGAVGSGLARALKQAGFRHLALLGKGRTGEQRLAKALKVTYLNHIGELQQEQAVIILALNESQIAAVARDLSRLPLNWPKLTVLHTSGSLGGMALQPLANLGAGIAAWHPYQTFPKAAKEVNLRGITFGVDGNRRGILTANRLTRAVGGVPLRISGDDRVLYHLSAVLACGFVAADLQMAIDVLKKIGIPEKRALQTVLPIARETLNQVSELGIGAAMTGPAIRGDKATISNHLRALRKTDPELAKVYSTITNHISRRRRARRGGS
jgi:predicted short-subunit dehydrogenase-like oxidoreductase (DUF2520 family)